MSSLELATEATGKQCLACATRQVVLEVLDIPEDYTIAEALAIVEAVFQDGILPLPAQGEGEEEPGRISWTSLIEKGIAAGVLTEQDA